MVHSSPSSPRSSLSSGEAEIETWAQPSPKEVAESERRKAYRKLPKELKQRIRSEDVKSRQATFLARQQSCVHSASARRPPSTDPLSDVSPIFPISDIDIQTGDGLRSTVGGSTPGEINNAFNRAVYEFAVQNFPYFRENCNLLRRSGDTFAVREKGELRAFVHEEVGKQRVVYGVGIRGPIGNVKEVRMFKVVL